VSAALPSGALDRATSAVFYRLPTHHQANTLAAKRAAVGSQPGNTADGTNSTMSAPRSRHGDSVINTRSTSIVCRHDNPFGIGVPVLGMIEGSRPSTSMVR